MDRIWGGKSANLSRTGISFSLIVSNWDNKTPSLFDIALKLVDTWPQTLLVSISDPGVVDKWAPSKQNAKTLFTNRIGSS